MTLLSYSDEPDRRLLGGAISIGNFDGVHRGHAELLRRLCRLATRLGGPAVAVTFDPPPAAILRPESQPPPLTTLGHRAELLRGFGVDGVVVIRTTRDLLAESAEDFFASLVVDTLQAKGIVEGPNFFFGRGRAGDPPLLRRLCGEAGIECQIVEPTTSDGAWISSTRIREAILAGEVDSAAAMLSRPYRISGVVTGGAGRGRLLGFPTANLSDIQTLIPAAGVYAGWAAVDGETLPAAIHIGPNPTFAETLPKVEVHLLDQSRQLYGLNLDVDFVRRIRGVVKFDSAEGLKRQIEVDLGGVREVLGQG